MQAMAREIEKAAQHKADGSQSCLAEALYCSNETHKHLLPWPGRLCG